MKFFLYSMRFSFTIAYLIMSTLIIFAQDIISMRNGDIIKARIQEISKSEIKYKKTLKSQWPTIYR